MSTCFHRVNSCVYAAFGEAPVHVIDSIAATTSTHRFSLKVYAAVNGELGIVIDGDSDISSRFGVGDGKPALV